MEPWHKPHNWITYSFDAGGYNVEKCTVCKKLCCIDPDMPKFRWDNKFFPSKLIQVNPDCNEELISEMLELDE